MPKITQSKQWETPQIEAETLTTETPGGMAPTMTDVMRSANARGQKLHNVKGKKIADEDVLPASDRIVNDERVGIRDKGYLVKKNLEFGVNALYNSLPPGMDIEDQEISDIRAMEMKVYDKGLGYPGDGWTKSEQDSTQDLGRPGMTNYKGKGIAR
jgi:hypothetical protein